jgi:hypothetical protein
MPAEFDWRDPDYTAVYAERQERLRKLKDDPRRIAAFRTIYAENPWQFIEEWGVTFDPRAIERGLIATIPFILWERQIEYLEWLYERWRSGERGLVEKTRDGGVTWLSVGFACCMWLFHDGFVAGFGSRKEELVDKRGDDKSIFEKVRYFLRYVPTIFMPEGWNPRLHSTYMRVSNPETGGAIIGEAGDEIGRGGRASMYFVDEAAFVVRQKQVDAALSQNTNCQIDVSTPNGNGNPFYQKAMQFDGTQRKFVFDWRDDPRKDDAWYAHQQEEQDEVTVAQEIDRDYNASQEDVFIPAKYVEAAVDAHIKLGFRPSGVRVTGFDVADTGDAKAIIHRHGSVITGTGQRKQGDITQAIPWAINAADDNRSDALIFDADGMGAPSMKLWLDKPGGHGLRMKVISYHGSGGVRDPGLPAKQRTRERQAYNAGESALLEGAVKTNADTYLNFRAQSATGLKLRFENTYNAIERMMTGKIVPYLEEELISIDSQVEDLVQLKAELSRPMRKYTENGKIKVESKKEMKSRGVQSPNLFDSAKMAFSVTGGEVLRQERDERLEYDPYEQVMDGVM